MRFSLSLSRGLAVVWLLAISSTINAHTWVEELRLIASNGTFVGEPGYMRGLAPRLPNVDLTTNSYLLPPNGAGGAFLPNMSICGPFQQMGNQTAGYPPLVAAPTDQVALRYLENGHVTLFKTQVGKPLGRGTVFIYGTTKPSANDSYVNVHRVWNAAGTGGNGNGKLLATRPFDDGRCFQVNANVTSKQRAQAIGYTAGGDVDCQADFQIPADAPTTGTYTVYWVWEWPSLFSNGVVQKNESYTSCMDITLTSNPVAAAGSFSTAPINGDNANSVAIQAYMTTQFSVEPSALPQVAADNPNPAPIPAGVQAPTQIPAAGATASASSGLKPAAQVSAAVSNGMVTVTVTEKAVETVTVTAMVSSSSAMQPATSITTSSIPAVSQSSSAVVPTGKPIVTPFLKPTKRSLAGRFFMI